MLELSAFYQSSTSQNVEWPSEEHSRFINSFLVGHIEEDKFVTYNSVGQCRDSFLNIVHRKLASAPTSKIPIAFMYTNGVNINSGEEIIKKINEPGIINKFKFKPFFLVFHKGAKAIKMPGIIGEVNLSVYKDPMFFWHYTELLRHKCSGYSKVSRDGTFYGTTIHDRFLNYCFSHFDYIAPSITPTKYLGIKEVDVIGVNSPLFLYNTIHDYPGHLARAYCGKYEAYDVNSKLKYLELMCDAHPILVKLEYNGWNLEELKNEFAKLLNVKNAKKAAAR